MARVHSRDLLVENAGLRPDGFLKYKAATSFLQSFNAMTRRTDAQNAPGPIFTRVQISDLKGRPKMEGGFDPAIRPFFDISL
jgi:hypothetical protein